MPLKVGIAGLVHDHVWWLLKEWDGISNAQVIAIGEPNVALHARAAAGRPGIRFHNSWREMLADTELDIVVVTTDNREARAVVEAAARKNIGLLLEKPLAADLEDGEAIYAVARSANIPFFVNWFTMWVPEVASVLLMAKRGDIGRIHSFQFRIAHAGPKEIGCTRNSVRGSTIRTNGTGAARWSTSAATAPALRRSCSALRPTSRALPAIGSRTTLRSRTTVSSCSTIRVALRFARARGRSRAPLSSTDL